MSDLEHLARTIKGVTFPYPLMVGGGIVKTHEHVRRLAPTDVVADWGSIETEESSGNGGRDYYSHYIEFGGQRYLLFALNSLGIPNPGMAYVEQHCRDRIKLYEDHGKPLVINISGKSVEDAVELVKRAIAAGFKVIILNGACPNKGGLPILCFDADAVSRLFERLATEVGETDAVLLWKISAGMPRGILSHNKNCVIESKVFTGMVTCNTVPNGFYYLAGGKPAIHTEKNNITRGGLSGPAIRPLALDHTQFCADGMPASKVVFGAGGADSVEAVMDFLRAGATMVQMTTAYREANEDPDFVRDLLEKLSKRLEQA